jgi:hypothetical protein
MVKDFNISVHRNTCPTIPLCRDRLVSEQCGGQVNGIKEGVSKRVLPYPLKQYISLRDPFLQSLPVYECSALYIAVGPDQNARWQRKFYSLFAPTVEVKLSLEQAMETHRVPRSRGSHIFLDSRLTDGGDAVSLTRQPPFTPRKVPGIHFC